jgi:hypothetical protein
LGTGLAKNGNGKRKEETTMENIYKKKVRPVSAPSLGGACLQHRVLEITLKGTSLPHLFVGVTGGEREIRESEERERGGERPAGVELKEEREFRWVRLPRTAADGCELDGTDPYGTI